MSAHQQRKPSASSKQLWKAHKYQLRCIARGISQKFLAYFLDPGLGKTTIILMLYKILKRCGLVKGLLVIAPLRPCYMVWPKEVKKWSNFSWIKICVLHNEWKIKKEIAIKQDYDIYVINPEGLKWLLTQLKGKRKWPFDMLVIDESTKFKNTSTDRFKLLRKIIPKFKRRYILTGTPMPNNIMNLLGQMYIVDMGKSLGTTKSGFQNKYLIQYGKPEWRQWKPASEKHEHEIYKRIAPHCIRMKGSDYLDLPKRIYNIIPVKLPKKAMRHYNEIEQQLFTEIENYGINAETASSVRIKCLQIASGRVYEDQDPLMKQLPSEKRKIIHVHNAKIEALQDLIEELDGKPLLTGYRFYHDMLALKKNFKDLKVMGKGTSMKQCMALEEQWNKGKISHMASYPGTSALGLNLQQVGNNVCYFSLVDDLEAFDQYIKRIERQGNKHSRVFVHLLLAVDTLDYILYKQLQNKDFKQSTFLKYIKVYAKNKGIPTY
ncbi:DEAD/DEAH box helicase [Patescibacteria group bacterium]|nr:DEAD/DEAH box helicase [Patescibacteria group bacterium]